MAQGWVSEAERSQELFNLQVRALLWVCAGNPAPNDDFLRAVCHVGVEGMFQYKGC